MRRLKKLWHQLKVLWVVSLEFENLAGALTKQAKTIGFHQNAIYDL
jgi:hypothetical protein